MLRARTARSGEAGRENERSRVEAWCVVQSGERVPPLMFLLILMRDFCHIEGEGETLFCSRPQDIGSVGGSRVF